MLRDAVPVEVVTAILGHASISTTLATYGHLTSEDARRVLRRRAGSPDGRCRGDGRRSCPGPAAGLLGKLMTAVRPEFRAGELAFDPADPVFGGGRAWCLAASGRPAAGACAPLTMTGGRPKAGRGWRSSPRRPTPGGASRCRWPAVWPAAAAAASPGRACASATPRPGNALAGLPCRGGWPASPPPACRPAGRSARSGPARCGREEIPFCHGHGNTWKANGRPDPGEFARGYAEIDPVPGHERIRLDSLAPQLKLEIQYALQRRRDERTVRVRPFVVMQVVRFLAATAR